MDILSIISNIEEEIKNCILSDENNWSHVFTGLKKYDDNGNEIEYIADEAQTEELQYYEKTNNIDE